MKQVAILSMQRICNYGSFLQAYGLSRLVASLGAEVSFADYHPGECLIPPDGGSGFSRKLSKAAQTMGSRAPMKAKLDFIRYKKNYAAKYYPKLGIGDTLRYTPEADLLIIGSDEVFNCVQNNTNVGFSPELFGADHRAKRLISYAASFGNTTAEKLGRFGVKEQVGEWLSRFDALSVRDRNSGAIVGELVGAEPLYHLDPVLAYDFVNECREIPAEVPEDRYMIVYGYSGRLSHEECAEIRAYARAHDLKILCIGGVQECCDRFVDCDPFEVIAYFQHADCVVTDTFHGTILSVITHRRFASLVREEGYGNSQKLRDLLERLHLTDRICTDPAALETLLESEPSYAAADEAIAAGRRETQRYLREQLELA